jgi:hypothetical protein
MEQLGCQYGVHPSPRQGAIMKSEDTQKPNKMNMDMLDKLIERENPDEMGLLDLIFIEELLNHRVLDAAA